MTKKIEAVVVVCGWKEALAEGTDVYLHLMHTLL